MTPRCVQRERRRMRRAGFRGRAGKVLATASHGRAHYIRVVEYAFTPQLGSVPSFAPYVELWETHDKARRVRILLPLASLVHLVQNIGGDELLAIAARSEPHA